MNDDHDADNPYGTPPGMQGCLGSVLGIIIMLLSVLGFFSMLRACEPHLGNDHAKSNYQSRTF
jgi:hypothetical protein